LTASRTYLRGVLLFRSLKGVPTSARTGKKWWTTTGGLDQTKRKVTSRTKIE